MTMAAAHEHAGAATLATLLADRNVSAAALEAHLDALSTDERIRQTQALGAKQLARLYEVAADGKPLGLEDLVPASIIDGNQVVFALKNSLPLFSSSEKRFARMGGVIVGYNHQSMSWATGPGYFTAMEAPGKPKEILFDYTRVPSTGPLGWPAPKSNAQGLSHLVYKNLHDFNRRVSRDVIIGRATKLGKPMNQYYVLARR